MSRAKRLRKAKAARKRARALERFVAVLGRAFAPDSLEFKVARTAFWREPWPRAKRAKWMNAVRAATPESDGKEE